MKKFASKNFIVSLVALAVSAVMLCGALYAWFLLQTKASGDLDLGIGGSKLEGELYLGADFNRDGVLDRVTGEAGEEEVYVAYAPVTGLLPTQVITLKLELKSKEGTQNAAVSVRLSDAIPADGGDTLGWFELTNLSAECGGTPYAFTRDDTAKMYLSESDLAVPVSGVALILRFRIGELPDGAQFDWSNLYAASLRAVVTVTPR